MIVGVMQFEIYMHSSRSLKDKRKIIKGLTQKLKSKFTNLSVSEVDLLNTWKISKIAVVTVSNERKHVNSTLDKALDYIKDGSDYQILDTEIDFLNY